jgi:hypothetical protein
METRLKEYERARVIYKVSFFRLAKVRAHILVCLGASAQIKVCYSYVAFLFQWV